MPKRPDDPLRDPDEVVSRAIPVGVRIAGAWSWRMVGVLVLLGVVVYLVIQLHTVVVPVLVATLLSGLLTLTPLKNRLMRAGWPKWLAVLVTFLGTLVVIAGLAVLVALVYVGPVQALIMLVGVIGVNQLESHVLQPLLMGGDVRLHPVAVVLTVATGSLLGGIAAAVFAVPFVAAMKSAVHFLAGGAWKDDAPPPTAPIPEEPVDRLRRRTTRPEPQDVTTLG